MASTPDHATEPAEERQVLEFTLGTERYAIGIEYIEEIADVGELTPIPNAPAAVSGVMDLRGRTTAVIDPKQLFDIEAAGPGDRVLVFDPERLDGGQAVGWTVDAVHEVVTVDAASVEEAPGTDDEAIVGVIRGAESFVLWVDPAAATV